MTKESKSFRKLILLGILFGMLPVFMSCADETGKKPLRVFTSLNIGESKEIELSNGEKVKLKLISVEEIRDSLRNAVRSANIKVLVDDEEVILHTSTYRLPVVVGKVQIDCPLIKSFNENTTNPQDGLIKDVVLRLWPKGSPYMKPGTFGYPIRQAWLATMSQSGNEPSWVDWGETPVKSRVYYHSGHDIGGAEGKDEIVAATDGLIIAANKDTLEGYKDFPGDIRTDVVYIEDERGWFYRYSHLDSVDPALKPGVKVKKGQKIGHIGKQGHSGGWVHLHFEIQHKENPESKWITEDAYAYCWEAYVNEYKPAVIAVARPHQIAWIDQEVTFDGSKSGSFAGDIASCEWTFTDGTVAEGAIQKKSYPVPGQYSEILKVTDSKGNIDYDFTDVQVYDRASPDRPIPTIQPAFYPTLNIKAGDPVTFYVRSFNTGPGEEVWDFGDGSPAVAVKSEPVDKRKFTEGKFAETVHSFAKSGHYVVSVERVDEIGIKAIAHMDVRVDE